MSAKEYSTGRDIFMASSLVPVLLGGLWRSLLISGGFIFLITLLMYLSPLPEWIVTYLVLLGVLASIIVGSMHVGKRVDKKGWLRGGISGLLYIAVILIVGHFLGTGAVPGLSLLSKLFLGFSFGCAGGILGINS